MLAVAVLCLSACSSISAPKFEGEMPRIHFTSPKNAEKAVALWKDEAEKFRQTHIGRRALAQAKSFQLNQSIRAWKAKGLRASDRKTERQFAWNIIQELQRLTANNVPRGYSFSQLPLTFEQLTPATATAQNTYLKEQIAAFSQDYLGQSSQISSHRFTLETSIDEWQRQKGDKDIAKFMRIETNNHFVTLYRMIEKFKPIPVQ